MTASRNFVKSEVLSLPGVKFYNLQATSLCNEFSKGIITFDHEITALEKIEVFDTLSKLFNGEVSGQRFGKTLAIFNTAKWLSVRKDERTGDYIFRPVK